MSPALRNRLHRGSQQNRVDFLYMEPDTTKLLQAYTPQASLPGRQRAWRSLCSKAGQHRRRLSMSPSSIWR